MQREGEKSLFLVAVTPRVEHNGNDMSLSTAGSFPELTAARLPPTSEGALASEDSSVLRDMAGLASPCVKQLYLALPPPRTGRKKRTHTPSCHLES